MVVADGYATKLTVQFPKLQPVRERAQKSPRHPQTLVGVKLHCDWVVHQQTCVRLWRLAPHWQVPIYAEPLTTDTLSFLYFFQNSLFTVASYSLTPWLPAKPASLAIHFIIAARVLRPTSCNHGLVRSGEGTPRMLGKSCQLQVHLGGAYYQY